MKGVRTALLAGAVALLLVGSSAGAMAVSPAPSPPAASEQPSGPSLSLPSLDPQKAIYQAIAGILFSFDSLLIGEMEKLWNPMVAGIDDLEGKENFGPGLVVDNSRLRQMWGVSLGLATGSLLVMLFALWSLLWMLGEAAGSRHDLARNLAYFLLHVILMVGCLFFC